MTKLQTFDQFINESYDAGLNRIKKDFTEQVYDNGYDTVEVSLKYARNAQDVFKDNNYYSKHGKATSSNTYTFKKEDDLAYFLEALIDAEIPTDELELS